MGINSMGPPEAIVLELANLAGARAFVETGTYRGSTTRWAAQHFDRTYTIERSKDLFRGHGEPLNAIKGVQALLGDSRQVLPRVLQELEGSPAVFWLDGHWSGEGFAGAEDECPLVDELALLAGRQGDVILIDDARFFLCAPQPPHNPSAWPTMPEIFRVIASKGVFPFAQVIDDVIFCIKDEDGPLKQALVRYAQQRAAAAWEQFSLDSQHDGIRVHAKRLIEACKRRIVGARNGAGATT